MVKKSKTQEQIFKKKLAKSASNIHKAIKGTWGKASSAPMFLHPPGDPVKRRNPFDGSEITVIPVRKFKFIRPQPFSVAAAGAYQNAVEQLKATGMAYRTFVPTETSRTPGSAAITPGARAMLSQFITAYCGEVVAYGRIVRTKLSKSADGEPVRRTNARMIKVGIDMAESKIFDAANFAKGAILIPDKPKIQKKKKQEDGSEENAEKTKKKEATVEEKKKKKKKETMELVGEA